MFDRYFMRAASDFSPSIIKSSQRLQRRHMQLRVEPLEERHLLAATIGLNFTGSSFLDSGFVPPDTDGAVGINHFVELINGAYAVYDKSNGTKVQNSTLDQFWTNAGAGFTRFTFDPRVIFDHASSRWFAVAVDNAGQANSFLLAVSKSANPTLGWTGFAIDSDPTDQRWADFPTLGVDAVGVYFGASMFDIAGADAENVTTTTLLSVPKVDLLGAVPSVANATVSRDLAIGTVGFTAHVAIDYGSDDTRAPYIATDAGASRLLRTNVTGAGAAGATFGATTSIAVPAFNIPLDADQPGTKSNLDAGDSRLSSAIFEVGDSLWCVYTVDLSGRSAIRWHEIDETTNAVLQSGTISDPNLSFYYPSIAANQLGDVVIGFSGSSATQFVSAYAVAGQTTGGTTTFGAPFLTAMGTSDYERLDRNNRNRWGDYSSTSLDPTDPRVFWTIQEFVSAPDVWSTRITQIFANTQPLAANDGPITTGASTPITIDVLANDFDRDGFLAPSSVTIVSAAINGTTVVDSVTGTVTYSPNLNFFGTDTFQYTVNDNLGAVSNVATVTVIVDASPIAVDDFFNTTVNTLIVGNILANDIDVDGTINPTTVQILKQPDNGTIALNPTTGVVTYTPNTGFEGGDTIQYRVRDNQGLLTNVATVVFRVGALQTLGGKVFVDLNTNGVMDGNDWPIEGVTIYLDKTDGQHTYTDLFVTNPDGSYQFTELVKGTYTLREQHPGFFDDGAEIPGTPAPASVPNDRFVGIPLAGGVPGANFNFTETRVTPQFIAAFVSRQAYFNISNSVSLEGINLGASDAWIALDAGINGQLQASAFASSTGSVSLTLHDKNLKQLARSTGGSLEYEAASTETFFIQVSGTSRNVQLSTFVIPPSTPAPAQIWHNSREATDVDGDGLIELQDILIAVDAINRFGIGSLTTRSVPSEAFLDVNGDGFLSPADILLVIDRVNRRLQTGTPSFTSSAMLAPSVGTSATDSTASVGAASPAESTSSAIAFALAVDSIMEETGSGPLLARRRRF